MIDYVIAAAKERLLKWGAAIVLSAALALAIGFTVSGFIKAIFSYQSKPEIQLVKPPAPECKVCHCHQSACHKECGTENMCNMRCEGLCKKKIADDAVDILNQVGSM